MYASIIELHFKPNLKQEALTFATSLCPIMEQIDGLNQMLSIDRGDDRATIIVVYDTKKQRDAAAEKAQEVLASMARFLDQPPERYGHEIIINEKF